MPGFWRLCDRPPQTYRRSEESLSCPCQPKSAERTQRHANEWPKLLGQTTQVSATRCVRSPLNGGGLLRVPRPIPDQHPKGSWTVAEKMDRFLTIVSNGHRSLTAERLSRSPRSTSHHPPPAQPCLPPLPAT